ncbi:site-specific DNA-methyltransferase [Exiguobacterium sp. s154]|uniref:site-specific DNA-methyltransferase n=1 Tax=Exiguobacterium sp. s154 TaxID=2751277 RepID=UPI001BE908E9|nr:site-specific DNA-methyltransferase [Exiguobacterium sp. s154]
MQTRINKEIRSILEKFGDKYFIEGNLNKSKVIQDLDRYDKGLLETFISNETIKGNFTIDINGNIVVQINKLIELFEADEYWQDSYTKYSKKIGLTSSGKFIDESTDVVLDFPYKDTVLKASMSKEDTDKDDLKPDEPFLNEVIAKEEIDVLLDKKILVNAKKYDKDGVREVKNFNNDDNLIIKGNNLLALHTLKDKFFGKVKMIYIDPPYNTENDSFKYNDNFNHSTWLIFMKNRLKIAKDFLSEDGVIFINTDEVEQAYLRVLSDEIFGRSNFVGDVIWKKRRGGGNDSRYMALDHDYIAVYAKNKSKDIHIKKWRIPYEIEYLKRYSEYDEKINKRYYWDTLSRDGLQNPIVVELDCPDGSKITLNSQKSKATILKEIESGEVRITRTRNGWSVQHRVYQPEGKVLRSIIDEDKALNAIAKDEISKLFDTNVFSNPKPEKLLSMFMNMVTEENDIVLDFFMGSSTTQAVAHKMNRRYIGIEQMDYINTVSVPRLQKVIEGEQGGISKDVDWQGGGSFVYAELMEKNRGFLNSIRDAENQSTLHKVFDFMLKEAEIDFKVDLEKVKDTLHELSLDDQKRTLIKIIDKNQLYYNYSEIDDENVRDLISDNDYAFNKSFYVERGE